MYDVAARGGGLRWDATTPLPRCFGYLNRIPPREMRSFSGFEKIQEILGDSLPAGPYRFSVAPVVLENLTDREVSVGVFFLDP